MSNIHEEDVEMLAEEMYDEYQKEINRPLSSQQPPAAPATWDGLSTPEQRAWMAASTKALQNLLLS